MSAPPVSLGSEDNFEDALWNNDFYSSSAAISQLSLLNHIFNLRKTVNIPNSMLSQLISTGLMGAADVAVVERSASRTLLMKASPSMKALESVLNGKPALLPAMAILEEEEADNAAKAAPAVLPLAPSQRASALTAQALNSARLAEAALNHRQSLSISTISESGYSTGEPTPTLDQPATFHTIKVLTKDYLPHLKTVSHSFPEKEVESGETKVSTGEDVSEHESTLFEDRNDSDDKNSDAPKHFSMLPDSAGVNISADPSPVKDAPTIQHAPVPDSPAIPQYKSMLDVSLEEPYSSKQEEKPTAKPAERPTPPQPVPSALSHSNQSPVATPKMQSGHFFSSETPVHKTPQSQKSPRSQIGRSPHQRSLSEIASESPAAGHRRSNTVGDIAALAKDPSAGSKRFSLRGLFKIKSKSHSLDKLKAVEEEPSQPKKITSKSFSTPNFSRLVEEKEDEPKASKHKDSRRSFFGMKKKAPAFHATQIDKPNPAPTHANALNVANDSSSAPHHPGKFKETPATPVISTPRTFATVESGGTPATAALHEESNTIREVDDSDYHPSGFPDMSELSIDEENLRNDPPTRMDGGKFGEEVSLEPLESASPNLLLIGFSPNPNGFGSPFALSYNSRQNSPQRESETENLLLSPEKGSLSPRYAHLLAGEVLFPRSLLAHEVESIVSLERSRSMKSVRSGKRSSFINYTGSDENIIIADSSSQNVSGMKRSGSILKKSHSISSIMAPLIDASLDAASSLQNVTGADSLPSGKTETLTLAPPLQPVSQPNSDEYEFENFTDLIEFSDFIDIDNLDFTSSPIQSPSSLVKETLSFAVDTADSIEAPQPEEIWGKHIQQEAPIEQAHASEEPVSVVQVETPKEPLAAEENPTIIIVDSSGLDPEVPQTPPREASVIHDTPESISKSPILDAAYKMAFAETEARVGSTAARPISMSFRGFSGSTLKNQRFVQSGSHQLFHLNDSKLSESLAVGEGFGTSDDEDDDEDDFDEDYDGYDDIENSYAMAQRESNHADGRTGLSATGSSANRAQAQARKYTGFQPPPLASIPFHHDRIPSVSDQSNTSSPRLFSSLISRIRKSPLTLPRPAFAKKGVQFSSRIILYDTFNGDEYDRHPDVATCNQLTPKLAQQIREELNEFKRMMVVHEDSRCNTYFF